METEDIATLMFETDTGIVGSTVISQVSAGRKNRLWFGVSGAEAGVAFDQERPELWVGRRSSAERIPRDLETLAPEAAAYVTLPGGHPQGYADCFDAFVGETYAAIAGEPPADGLPLKTGCGRRGSPRRSSSPPAAATGRGAGMRLGRLTACMPERSLEEVAAWAGEHGYEALELAAWPRLGDRPFVARHVAADEFDEAEARVRTALYDNGLELSALAFYDNNLHPEPRAAREIHDHLRACVDAAAALGRVPVGTFVGRDNSLSVAENLREAERVFPPLVDYAGERG